MNSRNSIFVFPHFFQNKRYLTGSKCTLNFLSKHQLRLRLHNIYSMRNNSKIIRSHLRFHSTSITQVTDSGNDVKTQKLAIKTGARCDRGTYLNLSVVGVENLLTTCRQGNYDFLTNQLEIDILSMSVWCRQVVYLLLFKALPQVFTFYFRYYNHNTK